MLKRPVLLGDLKQYSFEKLKKDCLSGLLVGIIAVPLSMALSLAAGGTVSMGLYTAAIGGFICALFGGSRLQISGPTGAFVSVIFGIIAQFGMGGLFTATVLSGLMLMAMAFLKGGGMVKYIPFPITLGFSTGVAVIILSSQLNDFFGFGLTGLPADVTGKWRACFAEIQRVNPYAVAIGIFVIALVYLLPCFTKKIPATAVALLAPVPFVLVFDLPVATIGSVFGKINTALPQFIFPDFSQIQALLPSSVTLAVLGAISTLLSASVADGMTGETHDPDTELMAQGIANTCMGFFGLLPLSGEVARTCTNAASGAKTPVAAIVHSGTILVVTLVLIPFAGAIPMAALAGILFTVCFNMVNWDSLRKLAISPKSDVCIFAVVLFVTVFESLLLAIELGIVFTAVLFLKRMADVTRVWEADDVPDHLKGRVGIYHIDGPMFFPVIDRLIGISENYSDLDLVVIDFALVPVVDLTAMRAIRGILEDCHKHHTVVYFANLRDQPLEAMDKARLLERVFATDSIAMAIVDYEQSMALREK